MCLIKAQFYQAMTTCIQHATTNRFVLGVSGGVDSMVLAHLMCCWTQKYGGHITAITVNHNLRPNSMAEAKWTQHHLQNMGIVAYVRTNTMPLAKTGIQQYARQVRYTLLHQACVSMGAGAVVVAHHYNDCLETVAMRQQQGSTPYGLSAMSMVHISPQGIVLRPLLKIHKKWIYQYADTHKIAYVNDPSNQNTDFTRVRMRQKIAGDFLYYNDLQHIYTKSVAFRIDMDRQITEFMYTHVTPVYGAVRIDQGALLSLKFQTIFYIIRHILMWVSGDYMPPRTKKIQRVIKHIKQSIPATLHRCYIRVLKTHLWIWREPYDIHTQNRFVCKNGYIALYGDCHTKVWDKTASDFADIPKLVQKTLPVQVYNNTINPLDREKMQKYDKNAILFTPPPFIL